MSFAKQNYDDAKWEEMYVPAAWQEKASKNIAASHGIVFIRTNIQRERATVHRTRPYRRVDEVYINDTSSDQQAFPPGYYTAYSVNRSYLIPTEYSCRAKAVISVRVSMKVEKEAYSENIQAFIVMQMYMPRLYIDGQLEVSIIDDINWAKENLDDSKWENTSFIFVGRPGLS